MKRILLVILVLSVASICYAADETEEITLTTYYPAPYGTYEQLQSNMLAIGSGAAMPTDDGVISFEPRDEPTGVAEGGIYYNSVDHEFKYHNGTNWRSIVRGSSGGSLGDTVLKGSLATGSAIGSSLSFDTDTDGFITITAVVNGGGDAWAELKIDGVLWGLGGIHTADNEANNRNFNAHPWVNATVPVAKGKTCTVTKRYRTQLSVDVYWTPLGS